MRWPWARRTRSDNDELPDDPRLSYSEADSVHGLVLAAQVAEEMGESELRQQLLKEVQLILRRGLLPPSVASVHSLKDRQEDSLLPLDGK